ncbi:MAG: DUF4962 domain-containing protein [Armatimonadota bacterium]|jgi:hypothetical protein
MYRNGLKHVVGLIIIASFAAPLLDAAPLDAAWEREKLAQGSWVSDDASFAPDADGVVTVTRGAPHHSRLTTIIVADLTGAPWLDLRAHASNAQWKLTGSFAGGPEIVIADRQTVGRCTRNLAELFGAQGAGELRLHMHIWGWGSGAGHYVRFTPSLSADADRSDAAELLDGMERIDASCRSAARDIRPAVEGHPRLRFSDEGRDRWRELAAAHPQYGQPLVGIIANLDAHRAEEPYVFDAVSTQTRRPAWGENLLSVRPPVAPDLEPGEGRDPFAGMATEGAWRTLYWHSFSHWLIGAALSDEPDFAEQAKRWALELTRWRFWLEPDYIYFDFGTAYPLQCLASAYDIASGRMIGDELAEVREAIATLADGLYLNTISGHGSIYNDLRGNHTAVTMCGLGMAGCVLLGEDERAPLWIALAERFMLDAFEEHTSGAWVESPSYGAYGVNEWLRLAEVVRNVTGRNHFGHPFLRRFAEYQLHIADWEGRDLGYNGGGAGQYWNQWVFHAIARQWQDPRFQWLARPTGEALSGAGYGDTLWWIDPDLAAQRPAEAATGRHFADIGVNVWRSGWEDDATILLHHCGMKGQHKEENMNHVTLYALGRRILPDGLGGGTADHNVVMVDDRIQNKWMPGATVAYHCDERSGYSLGDAQSAYFGWRRHVLFLRPDLVVLIDDVPLGDRDDRDVRFMLHPSGETVAEGALLTVRSGEVALQAMTVLPDGSALPMAAGAREQQGRATHDAWASYTGRGDLRAVTLLLISPAPDPPAPSVTAAEGVLHIAHGDREFVLGLREGDIAQGFSTNADLWLARLVGGVPEAILVPGAEEMGDVQTGLRTPAGVISGSPAVSWGAE